MTSSPGAEPALGRNGTSGQRPAPSGSRAPAALAVVNVAAKCVLVGLLVHAAVFPDLDQYQGKGMPVRIVTYPISALLVPAVWFVARGRDRGWAYPHVIDLCLVLPFLIDTAGNAANLYDSVDWWDDAMHFVTWVPWVVAFGLVLRARIPSRLVVAGLTVGFGAVTHILWEIGEYFAFIRGNPDELAGAYTDTLGDLAMSLAGSFTGACLVATLLWRVGRPSGPDTGWERPAG